MTLPFYISWSAQNNVKTFEVTGVDGVNVFTKNELGKEHELIDLSSISYQAHFGHNHPKIVAAIKNQLDSICMSSPKGIYPQKIEATNKLLKLMNKSVGKIFYTTGGAETVENALKIARQITQKKIILARSDSYHGASMGALGVTGDWRNPPHLLPREWVERIPSPVEENALLETRELILKIGPENIAGIILETITGGNGVIIPSKDWWDGIQKLCREFNLMLILDEVVCGFNRTGPAFGYMNYKIEPDLICMAKGITGGMIPFGALWTSQKIADYYNDHILALGLTNYAHPLGVAAMNSVLDIVNDKNFQIQLEDIIKLFHAEIESFVKFKVVKAIRKIGMLAAIDLNQNIPFQVFFDQGLYLVAQEKRLILAPPLIINEAELFQAISKLKIVLEKYN
jgi:taurine--2-oxoglutarate transaminase